MSRTTILRSVVHTGRCFSRQKSWGITLAESRTSLVMRPSRRVESVSLLTWPASCGNDIKDLTRRSRSVRVHDENPCWENLNESSSVWVSDFDSVWDVWCGTLMSSSQLSSWKALAPQRQWSDDMSRECHSNSVHRHRVRHDTQLDMDSFSSGVSKKSTQLGSRSNRSYIAMHLTLDPRVSFSFWSQRRQDVADAMFQLWSFTSFWAGLVIMSPSEQQESAIWSKS